MVRLVTLAVVLCVPALLRAETPQEALKKLEGTWTVEKLELKGDASPAELLKMMTLTIKGDQVTMNDMNDDPATIAVDPSKSPGHISFTDKKKKVNLGLYRLDGDKLEMVMGDDDKPRATEFKSTKENMNILIILKRKK